MVTDTHRMVAQITATDSPGNGGSGAPSRNNTVIGGALASDVQSLLQPVEDLLNSAAGQLGDENMPRRRRSLTGSAAEMLGGGGGGGGGGGSDGGPTPARRGSLTGSRSRDGTISPGDHTPARRNTMESSSMVGTADHQRLLGWNHFRQTYNRSLLLVSQQFDKMMDAVTKAQKEQQQKENVRQFANSIGHSLGQVAVVATKLLKVHSEKQKVAELPRAGEDTLEVLGDVKMVMNGLLPKLQKVRGGFRGGGRCVVSFVRAPLTAFPPLSCRVARSSSRPSRRRSSRASRWPS